MLFIFQDRFLQEQFVEFEIVRKQLRQASRDMSEGQEVSGPQGHLHPEEIRIRKSSSDRAQGLNWFDQEPA